MTAIRLRINGAAVADDVPPRLSLADFLRERRNLTGTHLGCEHGVCGACTILVDGEPARSCLMLAVACDEREITTIEGFSGDRGDRCAAAEFSPAPRTAMRVLHAGNADHRARPDPARNARGRSVRSARGSPAISAAAPAIPTSSPQLPRRRRSWAGRRPMPDDRFGVGASLLRREDDRHLHGRGQFVADIKLPGTMDVAFVRSPHAHARIRSISVPPEARGRVFTAADLPRVKPIRVVSHSTGAKSPPWPPLATDKVRYVGEAIAACIAPSRGEAEDLANAVSVDFEILDAVVDAPRDMRGSRHPVHEQWGDNLYIEHVLAGRRHRRRGARGRCDGDPRISHAAAVGRAARMPWRARLSRLSPRRGRGLCLDPDAAYRARRIGRDPRSRGALHPRRRARCRRRVRAQGPALPGRNHPCGIGIGARSPGALDRGPQRASADHRAYPRPSLQGHRLRRPARPHSRRRRRDRRRCRRLRAVAAGALS